MGNQTIKLTGLEEYSPITAALQEQYNSLQTNISKRRLMYDCLRNGYALEVMGLGGLVDLLARQDFMAMSEAERRARFMALANALTGDISVNPASAQSAPPAAPAAPAVESTDPGPAAAPEKSASTATTHTDDDMMTTRVEEPLTTSNPGALKLRNSLRKK
ncbi:hypothetical protein [Atlantibacter hermannii]|uniref:hypothetical protein n=1 Tax=Atlantibacter hermannii TaxID=565 RepID=UPI0028A77F4E|nr:hypothetical protein [Atlantibacter hermannii]